MFIVHKRGTSKNPNAQWLSWQKGIFSVNLFHHLLLCLFIRGTHNDMISTSSDVACQLIIDNKPVYIYTIVSEVRALSRNDLFCASYKQCYTRSEQETQEIDVRTHWHKMFL